ncbi:Hypothetical protein NTJ_08767 [Nesidiocoris tenuis]|uniref:OAR domain-containing protein n=1 Tax=Nesidiocoris tenuis TaxID=355587 RepID=A0ABN7AVC8_9HEMI|nr:Hypothetical protein NTJ_08767 [Nesidiocoris tenuis]
MEAWAGQRVGQGWSQDTSLLQLSPAVAIAYHGLTNVGVGYHGNDDHAPPSPPQALEGSHTSLASSPSLALLSAALSTASRDCPYNVCNDEQKANSPE